MKYITGLLLCAAISLLAYSLPALATPSDQAIAAAEAAEDRGKARRPKVEPDRRAQAPTEAAGDTVEALQAELRRLRVQLERCER